MVGGRSLLGLQETDRTMQKKRLVVLSGAGISAESGIQTFRDADGLWMGHDVMQVASPEGWARNPDLVLEFYNARRKQLLEVEPNAGHRALVDLEKDFEVIVVTQNVDDLHERAGSREVLHIHGELRKVRSTRYPNLVYAWDAPLYLGDLCERGAQLRPHIVWFGEEVLMMERAASEVALADILLVVGTSLQVYPAAGLLYHAAPSADIYYVDPKPAPLDGALKARATVIPESGGTGLPRLRDLLMKKGGTRLY